MNFEKLTQQQIKLILLDVKNKGDRSKEADARSIVADIKQRILSVITAGDE